MKIGDRFHDHARPIGAVMAEVAAALREFSDFKRENPDFAELREEHRMLKEHMQSLEDSGVLGWVEGAD